MEKKKARNSCKAVIIEDNQILTIKKIDGDEVYHVLPGGGQEFGEQFIETVSRECFEEIGVRPKKVGDILFIREYIGKNHDFPKNHKDVHQVEYMFLCEINKQDIKKGIGEDMGQIGIEWIPITQLLELNFYPKKLVNELIKYVHNENTRIYLGDIN
jgi:8-oxo-dGTP diphosphatase